MPTEEFGSNQKWLSVPISDLGLSIAGSPLEPILAEFMEELRGTGIHQLRPVFYLSAEWGVPFGTVAIAIPFYLARAELTKLHAARVGYVEGVDRLDILRYLRHEMGHVMNYAYKLYDMPRWTQLFGSIEQDYEEEYHPNPFSRKYVHHLPGFYAQKHPDEDWAETFAVWMTPDRNWRTEYADWPESLAKLTYCDEILAQLKTREPLVTANDLDEDVGDLVHSLDDFYAAGSSTTTDPLPRLESGLRSIFKYSSTSIKDANDSYKPAVDLIHLLEPEIMADVYRWTAHFPERTRGLLRHFGQIVQELQLCYKVGEELTIAVAMTALVTALAASHVRHGNYWPKS
jgi:Putative zinc-binding metallo-peptidase